MSTTPDTLDVSAPASKPRRSDGFTADLDDAKAAGCHALVAGSGVNDLLVDHAGRSLRLPEFLRSLCGQRGLGLAIYSLRTGVTSYPTLPGGEGFQVRNARGDASPADILERLIDDLVAEERPGLLVLDHLDTVLPAEGHHDLERARLVQQIRDTASLTTWRRAGLQLVLVDRGSGIGFGLPQFPGIRPIHVGSPDVAETTVYTERKVISDKSRLHLEEGFTAEEYARLTGGLLLSTSSELAAQSTPDRPVTRRQVATLKAHEIHRRSGGVLDLATSTVGFDQVAGVPNLKYRVQAMQLIGRRTGRFLLQGPPGTGKSYSSCAIGHELGVPVVTLGQIMGPYVGQSERQAAEARDALMALSPCLLAIDEGDERGLGKRGAGGTANEAYGNVRALMYEFLGDPGADSGVSVVVTTNMSARLDAAVLSRFAQRLPILFPSGPELAEIVRIGAERAGVALCEDLTDLFTDHCDRGLVLSGRSAVEVLDNARVIAAEAGRREVGAHDISVALDRRMQSDWSLDSEYSTLTAITTAGTVDALPWVAAERLGQAYPMPAYLRPYLSGTEIDLDRMALRVAELERAGVYR